MSIEKGVIFFSLLPCILLSQPQKERWIYRNYDFNWGTAYSIAYGLDYNLYIAGVSDSAFTVVSIDTAGKERWVYTYNPFGYVGDYVKASSIVYGADGNIYACGILQQSYSDKFMYVVSLNSSGQKRWDFMPAYNSEADEIIYGGDGNIYVAADSLPLMTATYMQVYSFNTSGAIRWIYTYDYGTNASSLVYGTNGYIYVTGQLYNQEFLVLAVDNSGFGKWSYTYDFYGNALSIAYGGDGKVYASGYTDDGSWPELFTVIALGDTSGVLQWMTRAAGTYAGSYSYNKSYSVTVGSDGNVYASGFLEDTSYSGDPQYRFYLLSLEPLTGNERWHYTYDYNQNASGTSYQITNGTAEYIYASGYTDNEDGRGTHFTVIKLSHSGDVSWIYQKSEELVNHPDLCAYDVIEGLDGNIYSAGLLGDSLGYGEYLAVVALDTQLVGVEEKSVNQENISGIRTVNTIFNNRIELRLSKRYIAPFEVVIYNICGSQIYRRTFSKTDAILSIEDERLSRLPSGIYFLTLRSGIEERSLRLIKIDH